MVLRRSPAVPHSLLLVDSSCGQNWCLCCCQMGQSWRMWWAVFSLFFAIAECRVHEGSSFQVCSQVTVSCSQPENSGLVMSCQMVDWINIGVVVSSGSFPLTFLFGYYDLKSSCLMGVQKLQKKTAADRSKLYLLLLAREMRITVSR